MNKTKGTKLDEKVTIIDLNDNGPVIIFFLKRK